MIAEAGRGWVYERGDMSEEDTKALIRRFRRAIRTLNDIMEELRLEYPSACYYLANDCMHIMKGPSHDENERMQQGNSLESMYMPGAGGGDW